MLIDTDTASDDAVALIMALRHPDVRVVAITVVSGNVPLSQGLVNALYTVKICDANVPVFAGCDRPLTREPAHAEWFHGRDGLGDMNYPPASQKSESLHAADAMIKLIRSNPGIVLMTLGPLTNVAEALRRDPEIAGFVRRCVVMGGNPCCEGNVTPAAEYNIWCDPEAAQIVFRSGMPIELVGWQLCRGEAALNEQDIQHVRSIDTELADFTIDCNRVAMKAYERQTGEIGIALPDPVAMAVALEPEEIVVEQSKHVVEIETVSELTRGMTVVDKLNVSGDDRNRGRWSQANLGSRATVVWRVDIPKWKLLLVQSLRR
jgi:purine nucleosidase